MKIVIIAFAVILLGFAVFRIFGTKSDTSGRRLLAPLVTLDSPKRENVKKLLQFTGDVVAIQQAAIYSKASGNLERVLVDMGTPVRRGQLLATIDTTELSQQCVQAAATYENARVTYQRTKELFEQNLVARQDVDNAEAAAKVSGAAYDAAKTRLSYAQITAPFAGSITKRFLDAGALVNPNNSILFTLMDLDQMKIIINVLERDIPEVSIGKSATVTVDAFPGKEFYGKVTRYSNAVDPATRTMAVEIDIPNSERQLKPGMFANVTLVIAEHPNAITVPTSAILKDDTGSFLYTVRADTAERIRVTLGFDKDDRTEILSGLNDTQNIITTGQQFVRSGAPVRVQK